MPYNPTVEQTAILGHDHHRHARVLAGPGTGKSATLVALLDLLVGEEPAPRIKLLTFTRAATAELAKKVSDHPDAAAERPSTVHSFSISVLLRNPGTGNFPEPLRIADKWEDAEIVSRTLARRINVHLKRLEKLIREMASNWESLRPEEDARVVPPNARGSTEHGVSTGWSTATRFSRSCPTHCFTRCKIIPTSTGLISTC